MLPLISTISSSVPETVWKTARGPSWARGISSLRLRRFLGFARERCRLGQPPRRPVGAREVVAGGQGVGVLLAQDPAPVGEHRFVQGDGLGQPPRRLVGAREVVA